MTKVLYIMPWPRTAGSETHVLDLVRHLNRQRYQVTVWYEGDWGEIGDEIGKAGAKVIRRPMRPYRPDHVLGAIGLIKKNRFDIVHSLKHGPNFMDAVVCKLSRVRVFITSRRNIRHEAGPLNLHIGERLRNLMTDHIIAHSETIKDLTIVREHVPATKISVIYNGVDTDQADKATIGKSGSFRTGLGIPTEAIVIGNLAKMTEQKGQSYLMKAFAEVSSRTAKDVYLVIHGEGPEEEHLALIAKELNIDVRVKLSTTPQDHFVVLSSFNIFALPSLWEGFSNALLEAMAVSLPCIASDTGGNTEVVVHNISGTIVPVRSVGPLAEAILKLVEDPALAKEFGIKGRELVDAQYTMERMVSAHERLYDELLGGDRVLR
jgi:glycosyltransferase involved in cell wall biosynthesis